MQQVKISYNSFAVCRKKTQDTVVASGGKRGERGEKEGQEGRKRGKRGDRGGKRD